MPPTPDDLIKAIKPGAVLFLKNVFPDSKKPHHHVLLNYPLGEDKDIAALNASTSIKGVRDMYGNKPRCLSALIESNTCPDTPFLIEPSIFDCNKPQIFSKIKLLEMYENGDWNFDRLSAVTDDFKQKLIDALLAGTGPQIIKNLFL